MAALANAAPVTAGCASPCQVESDILQALCGCTLKVSAFYKRKLSYSCLVKVVCLAFAQYYQSPYRICRIIVVLLSTGIRLVFW